MSPINDATDSYGGPRGPLVESFGLIAERYLEVERSLGLTRFPNLDGRVVALDGISGFGIERAINDALRSMPEIPLGVENGYAYVKMPVNRGAVVTQTAQYPPALYFAGEEKFRRLLGELNENLDGSKGASIGITIRDIQPRINDGIWVPQGSDGNYAFSLPQQYRSDEYRALRAVEVQILNDPRTVVLFVPHYLEYALALTFMPLRDLIHIGKEPLRDVLEIAARDLYQLSPR